MPFKPIMFLQIQNANEAGAKQFLVIVDIRQYIKRGFFKKSFLSEEMENWQGPVI